MKKMKAWKSYKSLRKNGCNGDLKKIRILRWRNSSSPLLSRALPNLWFDEIKMFDMSKEETKFLYQYYE